MDKEPSGPSSTGSRSAGGFGLFGSASPQYSKTALASMSPLSPYLNVDPRYLTHTGEIRWPIVTLILNMVTRQALLYSAFGVIFEKARGAEDDLNTIAAGTLTGYCNCNHIYFTILLFLLHF
uniref:Uncharacterized protein n=1 Tax=Sinocyclocheilus rhinocerous TaxID=307959 RepID=A0A673MBB2_9TELE